MRSKNQELQAVSNSIISFHALGFSAFKKTRLTAISNSALSFESFLEMKDSQKSKSGDFSFLKILENQAWFLNELNLMIRVPMNQLSQFWTHCARGLCGC
jgi:hypothetical protein